MDDPGGFIKGLLAALMALMPQLMQAATDAVVKLLSDRGTAAWTALTASVQQSDVNFVSRTPAALSYNLGGVTDLYHQFDGMFLGIGAFACVFTGISALCRTYAGWGWGPGEAGTRVVLGMLLGSSAPRLYEWSIEFNNRLCDAIVMAPLPSARFGEGMDALTIMAVIIVWLVLGFRLLWRMGYRLVYFDVLLIVGPLGLAAWAIPGGEPYANWWLRTYVGLLLGQDLVTIALRVASMMNGPLGATFAGLALGIGALLLAYDLATVFAEIRGGGLKGVVAGAIGIAKGLGAVL